MGRNTARYTEREFRNIQNKKRTETDSIDDDKYDEEEEEIPEETGRVCDTSEIDRRFEPMRTDPENDSLQLHTYGVIPHG